MYPDLLEVFGVALYGAVFERVLFVILGLLMVWGLVSSVQLVRHGRRAEGVIQGGIVSAVLYVSVVQLVRTFGGGYVPLFEEPLVVHTYAFCVLVGVGFGTCVSVWLARRRGISPVEVAKLCLLLVLFGMLGARLAHVVVEAPFYWRACFEPEAVGLGEADCWRALKFSEGGMTFYGGVLAGFVVIAYALFLWKRKGQGVRVFELTDILVPGLAITHAFGRVGCLAAGCCWGALSTGHVGVHYDAGSFPYAELYQEPAYRVELLESGHTPLLHATQLYEAGGEFLLFVILCLMAWKRFRPGMMTATWLMGYGVWRFIVEAMRGDSERGYFFAYPMETVNRLLAVEEEHATILTTSQGIAILMVLIGIGIILVQRKSFAKTEGSSPGQGLCGGADL